MMGGMTAANPPPIPRDWDRYLATEQAIYRRPIELIEHLRNRQIRRGDGGVGPMTFEEIAGLLSDLAAKHAEKYSVTPVVVSHEAVRRWWRHFHPEAPMRAPRGSRTSKPAEVQAVTLSELEAADPATAAQVRAELGL